MGRIPLLKEVTTTDPIQSKFFTVLSARENWIHLRPTVTLSDPTIMIDLLESLVKLDKDLIVDFNRTYSIGLERLGFLVSAQGRLKQFDHRLVLIQLHPYEISLLKLLHLDRYIPYFPTLSLALKSL